MKYSLFTLFITLSFFIIATTKLNAQSPTPDTETETESSDEAVQQNLKDRLKKVIEEKSERIQGIMDGDQNKRGFIGTVQRISEEALTVDTPRGTLVLTITPELQFWSAGKTITRTDIEIENQVVMIGTQSDDEFLPERIYVSKTSLQPPTRRIVLGTINEINRTTLAISPRTGEQQTFSINNQTKYTNKEGEEIEATDLEEDQDVLVIVLPEDATNRTAQNSGGRITLLRTLGN